MSNGRRKPEDLIFRVAYGILFITLLLMTWAYMVQAESLKSFLAYRNQESVGTGFDGYLACTFNQLCTCSNPGPDLGIVTCSNVPFGSIPLALNYSRVLTLSLTGNDLQVLPDKRLVGSGVRRLQIKQNNLRHITSEALFGLEKLLWELDLRNNELTTVPSTAMRNLKKLELLDLSDNRIAQVSSSSFHGVESTLLSLSLANNFINKIQQGTFTKFTTIKQVDLSGNKIFEIQPSSFPSSRSLTTLSLSGNQLRQIPYNGLSNTNLNSLDLSDNIIEDVTLAEPAGKLGVTEVDLSRNRIGALQSYSLNNFRSVSKISFELNPLEEILDDAFKGKSVTELDFSNCIISLISPKAFRGLGVSLTKLDLSFNNITEIDSDIFNELGQLMYLNLAENQLVLTAEDVHTLGSKIQNLNLVGNPVTKNAILHATTMPKLRVFNVSELGTATVSWDSFNGSGPGLEELNLNNAKVTALGSRAFRNLPNLKYLDLSGNRISSVDANAFIDVSRTLIRLRIVNGLRLSSLPLKALEPLTNLRELDLSSNTLTSIPEISPSPDLEKINFRFNKISSVDFKSFSPDELINLRKLFLGFNSIGEVPSATFQGLRKLEYLELNDNKITKILPRAFLHLNELRVLNLAGNKLTDLKDEAFQNLPQLQILDLSHNMLTTVNFEAFDTIGTLSLLQLRLGNNNLKQLITDDDESQKPRGKMGQGGNSTTTTTTTTPSPPKFYMSSSSIEMLDLSGNGISYISPEFFHPISNTLMVLDLSSNDIGNLSSVHLLGMAFLQKLDLSENEIQFLDPDLLLNSQSIQILNLDNNQLNFFPEKFLAKCSKLRFLSVANNNLRQLDATLFDDTRLEILDVSGNNLKTFPERALAKISTSLTTLDISENEIASVFEQLECLQSIRQLNLARNKIVFMSDNVFDKVTSILTLDLSQNPLERLTDRMFENIQSSLVELNISHLGLEGLPEVEMKSLTDLDASYNKLKSFPSGFVKKYPQLKAVDFGGNEMMGSQFALEEAILLTELNLESNPITILRNDSFFQQERLLSLDISHLPLESVEAGTFQSLTALETLHVGPIEDEKILATLLQLVPTLRHLHIEMQGGGDDLGDVMLPHKISKVTISGENLRGLGNTSFEGLHTRELELVFMDTSVPEIPTKLYSRLGITNRLHLEIKGNNSNLRTIRNPNLKFQPAAFSPYLYNLDLSGNLELLCSCESGWIEFWLARWMQTVCGTEAPLNSWLQCEQMLNSLRDTRCADKGKISVLRAFQDLDCGWNNGAHWNCLSLSLVLIVLIAYII